MDKFVVGNDLPCFKYILANINDSGTSTTAAFTLAYIQYLNRSGIQDYFAIEKSLRRFSLVAQMNFVSRTTPIDLLEIKGKKYRLTDEESFDEYVSVLLKECRNGPMSFSALYKKVDSRLSICNICPMSLRYTCAEADKEIKLAKYVFQDSSNFNTIISCYDDIDKLFTSYTDLYTVLNNLTKSYCAPLYHVLFSSIYSNVSAFFNSLFGTKEYTAIQSAFVKNLNKYGVSSRCKNISSDFDKQIYDFLTREFESVEDIDKNVALQYSKELLRREPYEPVFDVDAVPSVLPASKTPKASADMGASGVSSTGKKKKKKKKTILADEYAVTTATSLSFDIEMGLLDDNTATQQSVAVLTEKISNEGEEPIHESISVEKADIVSSQGDVIVEHIVEEDGVMHYDDDADDFDETDFDETDYDYDEAGDVVSESVQGTTLPLPMDDNTEDEDNIPVTFLPLRGNVPVDDLPKQDAGCEVPPYESDGTDDLLHDKERAFTDDNVGAGEENTGDVNVVSESSDEGTDSDPDEKKAAEQSCPVFSENDLLTAFPLSSVDMDDIQELLYDNQIDRIISLAVNNRYLFMEPACYLKNDTCMDDYILVSTGDEVGRISLGSVILLDKLMNCHKYCLFSMRSILLYSVLSCHDIRIGRKDAIIPLHTSLSISECENINSHAVSYLRQMVTSIQKLFYSKKDSGRELELSPELQETTLLVGALGGSLRRDRFIKVNSEQMSFSFGKDFSIEYTPFSYQNESSSKAGNIYYFSFQDMNDDNSSKYYALHHSIILKLCEGACFNKFNLQILSCTDTQLIVFADCYCMDYISNFILMNYFKLGALQGIQPLHISVEKVSLMAAA